MQISSVIAFNTCNLIALQEIVTQTKARYCTLLNGLILYAYFY